MNSNLILLADDERDILEFLSYNLRREGFEVQTASNGREAIEQARKFNPGLIVLDMLMPVLGGIEACRQMRHDPQLNDSVIALLTARGEDITQIEAFDAGADDFIRKPVKPRVFVSRIRALLRRNVVQEESHLIEVGHILIDKDKYAVWKDGLRFALSKKEFEMLILLASKPGKVFSREEIFAKVWGSEVIVGERTIDVHIRKIREKLGEETINTIKGVGYCFQ